MVGYNGVRLIYYLYRRSHSPSSSSLFHHPNPKILIAGGLKGFTAGLGNPITNHTPQIANLRNSLFLGLYNLNLGATRSIHGTAPLSARDYHDILGVRKNATASEIKKAYFEVLKDRAVNDQEKKRSNSGFSEEGSDPFKSRNFYDTDDDPIEHMRNNSGFSEEGSSSFKSSNFHNAGHDRVERKRKNSGLSNPFKSMDLWDVSNAVCVALCVASWLDMHDVSTVVRWVWVAFCVASWLD